MIMICFVYTEPCWTGGALHCWNKDILAGINISRPFHKPLAINVRTEGSIQFWCLVSMMLSSASHMVQIFPIRPSEVIISLYRIGCCDPANDVTVPYVHLIGCQSLLWLRAEGENVVIGPESLTDTSHRWACVTDHVYHKLRNTMEKIKLQREGRKEEMKQQEIERVPK